MNIIRHIQSHIKKYVVLAMFLVMFIPAAPALAADETNTNTGAVDTTSTQAADTGTATVDPNPTPTPDNTPPAVDSTTPPTTDTTVAPDTTSSTDSSQTPSTDTPPVCPTHDPLEQGNPDANTTSASTVNNCLNSGATSGDAAVVGSTGGGNATSGNADVQATLLNMLNTLSSMGGGDIASFVQNVYGDQNGALHIDPSALAAIIAAQANVCGCGPVSASSTGQINNDINLNATTGNASVADGWHGGNATTGDASVEANIINIINSMLAGHTFLGTINIYGNLNGDILLPAGWYDSLLASNNGPPGSGGCGCGSGGGLNADTTQAINNNINAGATTGNATVEGNHHGGDATTGNALTTLNIINLANRQIVGGNVLLVFVNVLGHWYGIIMDAPVGQNTAVLGGGITQNTDCGCALNGDYSTNGQINNNINLAAQSGDASVTGNRRGGNATTGNATTSLNLVNIINSQLSLANWLGILFINVFGTWTGNLGVEPAAAAVNPSNGSNGGSTPPIFHITPAVKKGVKHSGSNGSGAGSTNNTDNSNFDDSNNDVLGVTSGSGGSSTGSGSSIFGRVLTGAVGSCICFLGLSLADRRKKKTQVPAEIVFPTSI